MTITYGSVCSGIEAATVAWHPLGWNPAWFAEIEASPSTVLAHHYPDVPNLGDMTKIAERIRAGETNAPDVLVGGTPCQAFSVAGMRGGLSDARGQLTISFVELANEIDRNRAAAGYEPATIIWENVPGVLSSKDNAFGCFLAALAGESEELQPPGRKWANAGYVCGPQRTIAWRILDAQYFGVAQRRRRVFVVASARKGFNPASVLFEFEGMRRDTAPSREQGQETAGALTACAFTGGAGGRPEGAAAGHFQPVITMAHGQGGAEIRTDGGAPTLTCNHEAPIAVYPINTQMATRGPNTSNSSREGIGLGADGDPAFTLQASHHHAVAYVLQHAAPANDNYTWAVRRLMPVECERLQAFPDDYTLVPVRNKPAADGPRYKALGNSMCVNVMHWIGKRVDWHIRTLVADNDNNPQPKSMDEIIAENLRRYIVGR